MSDVSIIIACYNLEDKIKNSVRSALSQSDLDLEVIVVDDASTDSSVKKLETLQDARIKIIRHDQNRGPGAARNSAIKAATGRWIAILDGDDDMSPGRLSKLITLAGQSAADIICDNPMVVDEQGRERGYLLGKEIPAPGHVLELSDFLKHSDLGYLKPIIKRDFIKKHALNYDENLMVGEDYHLLVDALIKGAKCLIGPAGGYHYKRREGSTSHRLRPVDINKLIDKTVSLQKTTPLLPAEKKLLGQRIGMLKKWLVFETMVKELKQKHIGTFLKLFICHPLTALRLSEPVFKRIKKISGTSCLV